MNKAILTGFLKASADQSHPLQTNIDFIFTDFKPNRNRQGVPESEAENIVRTGINMPVKANFTGGAVKGHNNAMPIGPITMMEQQGDKIVGHAVIWKDEFPDLTQYLEEASKDADGVQFSWELYYKNAEADVNGTLWLHDCIVAGAAIVADPAYAGRTHLLALAEENKMNLDELKAQVSELSDKLWSMLDSLYAALSLPGSIDKAAGIEAQFTAVIEALKGMAEAKASLEAQLTEKDTQLAAAETSKSELETELTELREYKSNAEAEKARAELLAMRHAELKDVITADEFESKTDFFAGLTDDQFQTYAETLRSIASRTNASVKSNASFSGPVPDSLTNGRASNVPTTSELAKALRQVNK
jgi:hypothetical protein